MNTVLNDAFGRLREATHEAVRGLTVAQLTYRPAADANSIAWLIWHLTRMQDDRIAGLAGTTQIWTADGWADRFALPFPFSATGCGRSSSDVAEVIATASNLLGYHDAVYHRTIEYLHTLDAADLSQVLDEAHNPPVTLGGRLVGLLSDGLQHAGQAAYVRGMTA